MKEAIIKDKLSFVTKGLVAAIVLIALLVLLTAGASAEDYYVATTGNDTTGNGTLGNPWETIQHAVYNASVSAGDEIVVYAGTYNENINVNKSVTLTSLNKSSYDVTVQAESGKDAITVSADHVNISWLKVQASGTGYCIRVNNVGYANISNVWTYATDVGIHLYNSSNSTLTNNNASSSIYGILLNYSSNNNITGNTANSNAFVGIYLAYSSNNNLTNNTATGGSVGINLTSSSSNNTLTGNNVSDNTQYGISLTSSSNNTIYNNYFNNTNNIGFSGATNNTWNTTQTPGVNIIGGPYLGGNFWAYPNGTGYSQTCTDADLDGICDSSYSLESGNIDYLPLSSRPRRVVNKTAPACTVGHSYHTTIQAAINNASAGDGIIICAGTYTESITVNEAVTLTAFNKSSYDVTVQAESKKHAITVSADHVNISWLKVQNALDASDLAGIRVNTSDYANLSYNRVTSTETGWTNYGIHLISSNNNTLIGNTVDNKYYGIRLESASNNTLTGNNASNNVNGIYLESASSNNNLTGNTANNNGYGIRLLSSSNNNNLTGNTAENNNNDAGIYLWNSGSNTLTGNTVKSNSGDGIRLYSANYNIIYNNYFNTTNHIDFDTAVTNTWNTTKTAGTKNIVGGPNLGGNFWAKPGGTGWSQTCTDADQDGICDSAYDLGESGNVDYLPLVYVLPVWNANTGLYYATIQAAVDAANPGDTITVAAGTYTENVNVTQSVSLVGAGADVTVVNASNSNDHVFYVTANYVNISGFTVQNATSATGIHLEGVDHCTISGNNASNNYLGIHLSDSDNNTISGNTVSNNDFSGIWLESSSSITLKDNTFTHDGLLVGDSYHNIVANNTVNGKPLVYFEDAADDTVTTAAGQVILVNCTSMTVSDQDVSSTCVGVELVNTNNSTILNTTANSNKLFGIVLAGSSNNSISNTTANSNKLGIYLVGSSNSNTLSGNTVSNNTNYGIQLDSSSANIISGNTISNSVTGAYLQRLSTSNIISGNTVSDNSQYGIILYDSSTNNVIYHNNLIANTQNGDDDDPSNNSWYHPVLLDGNYWSDYTGVDDGSGTGEHAIAGDGIGDTNVPHPGVGYDDYPFMMPNLWDTTTVSIGTATQTGTAQLSTSSGYWSSSSAVNESSLPSAGKPQDASFPHGLFSFTIAGLTNGSTVTVTIELPDALPSTGQYWKYGANGSTSNPQPARWYTIPLGSNDGNTIITIQLTDGGIGDDDGIENGVIIDQGGPALVPDLTLNSSNITFSPTSPTEGEPVTITALVQNIGDANASDFTVSFFDGASLIGNDTISVNVTSPSNASITWTAVAGDHSIRVVADAEDVTVESDEGNNEAARTITVLKMPQAIAYGGGGASRKPPMNVQVDPETGAVTSNTTLTVDGATLIIPEGTIIKDAEGNPLSTSIIMLSTATTAGRVGAIAAFEFGPSGITFEPPVDLVIAYDPADLPEGFSESDLVIRMWDGTAWVDLETTVDTVTHTATAKVSHFTIFALFAAPSVALPPTPPPVVTPTPPPAVTPTPVPTPPLPFSVVLLVFIIAIVIIVIIVAVAYVVLRRRP